MISKFIIYKTFLAFLLLSPGTVIAEQDINRTDDDKAVGSDALEPFGLTPDAPLTSTDLTPLEPLPSKQPPEPSPGIDDYHHHAPSPKMGGKAG
jgi:hypothetical protein